MTQGLIFLVVAALVGAIFGAVASWRRQASWTDLIMGAVGFGVIALPVSLVAGTRSGFFALVNQAYLLAVVGVPVAAIVTVGLRGFRRNSAARGGVALVVIAGLIAAAGGVWASFIEPNRLVLRNETVAVSGVVEPVVVGVIADLQTPSVGDHETAAVAAVVAEDPDIVVLPGDLFQMSPEDVGRRFQEFVILLETLTASVEHVVIIDGDVDFPGVVKVMAEEAGATFLSDQVQGFEVDGQTVHIAGLRTMGGSQRAWINPLVAAELNAFAPDDIVLLLAHPPDPVLALPVGSPVDLTIAGHTHGGQVAIPGIGPIVTFSAVPRDAAAGGLSSVGGQQLYVSTGVGAERGHAPLVRFGVPPEVGVLTLVAPGG